MDTDELLRLGKKKFKNVSLILFIIGISLFAFGVFSILSYFFSNEKSPTNIGFSIFLFIAFLILGILSLVFLSFSKNNDKCIEKGKLIFKKRKEKKEALEKKKETLETANVPLSFIGENNTNVIIHQEKHCIEFKLMNKNSKNKKDQFFSKLVNMNDIKSVDVLEKNVQEKSKTGSASGAATSIFGVGIAGGNTSSDEKTFEDKMYEVEFEINITDFPFVNIPFGKDKQSAYSLKKIVENYINR